MYYPDEIINEVREKNDIVDVINESVGLQKSGSEWKCCCPFHHEKTPSFYVSRDKQMYYCFGCHAGGNVITWKMKYENVSFTEAVQDLAKRAGVQLPERELSAKEKKVISHRQQLYEVNRASANYFYALLTRTDRGRELGLKYYHDTRKFTDETIHKFGLGYAALQRDDLYQYLKGKGFTNDLMRDAGLVDFDERTGPHDRFWNRVMVPILDINGKIIGFGGRVLGDAKPKYVNTKDTEIFDKGRNLFGLNIARHSRRRGVILCEGYMDVISQHQAGFDNAIASLGTALTENQAALIKRYTSEVYLAYDSDGAGISAAKRAIGILRNVGLSQRIIDLKPYKDPDEFLKNLGAEAYEERIKNAITGRIFEIHQLREQYDINDPEEKTRFMKATASILAGIDDITERGNYIESVSQEYVFNRDEMKRLVTTAGVANMRQKEYEESAPGAQREQVSHREKKDPYEKAQKTLLTMMVDDQSLFGKLKGIISLEDFTSGLVPQVAEYVFQRADAGEKVVAADIINHFEDVDVQTEASSMFNSEFSFEMDPEQRQRAINDLIIKVKIGNVEKLQKEGAAIDPIELARRKNKIMQLKVRI